MKNTGGRPAGSITAGLVPQANSSRAIPGRTSTSPGTAYTDRESATQVKGPTGMVVRLFAEFLLGRS